VKMTRRDALVMLGSAGVPEAAAGSVSFLGPLARRSPGRHELDQEARRNLLYDLLGDLPDRQRAITARLVDESERDGYVLETLELDLNGIEPVPAFFVRPPGTPGSRLPAVLFNHSHGGDYDIGKREFLEGRAYLQPVPYAKVITGLGWTGLCIDAWVFGARGHTSEMDTFKAMLWHGKVLWGMMVYDSLRAIDYLTARPDVDPQRIGTLGMSMGSTMAWWLAALDERIRVTVDLCCLTEFHTLLRCAGLRHHGIYYYVPGLLRHFTTADINALIAPRPHLAVAGRSDPATPAEGLDIIDRELSRIYGEMGAPDHWRLVRYDVGHQETPEARLEAIAFLQCHL